MATSSNAPTFFILHGRCGSTLLQKLLHETGAFQLYGQPPPHENAFADGLINRLGCVPNSAFDQMLADDYARYDFSPDRPVFSKLPNYAFIVTSLSQVVPNSRFICIERALLDVIRSLAGLDRLQNVRHRYVEGAPGIKAAMLRDYRARSTRSLDDSDGAMVALYTAYRMAEARRQLAAVNPQRVLTFEFLDWMENFRSRSQDIAAFVGLPASVVGFWESLRKHAAQETSRALNAVRGDPARLGILPTDTSFRQPLAPLPSALVASIAHLNAVYGLEQLPAADSERRQRKLG